VKRTCCTTRSISSIRLRNQKLFCPNKFRTRPPIRIDKNEDRTSCPLRRRSRIRVRRPANFKLASTLRALQEQALTDSSCSCAIQKKSIVTALCLCSATRGACHLDNHVTALADAAFRRRPTPAKSLRRRQPVVDSVRLVHRGIFLSKWSANPLRRINASRAAAPSKDGSAKTEPPERSRSADSCPGPWDDGDRDSCQIFGSLLRSGSSD